jgi:hypothetical protein
MDPQVAALQNAINRFAAVGGFPRVSVDGLWGSKTRQGVYSALAFIGQGKCYQGICPGADTSRDAARIMTEWDETQAAAGGLAAFIGDAANTLGLPHVASPVPSGGGGPAPIVQVPSLSPTIMDRLRGLSLWQQILLGLAAGLGIIFVANRISKRA